MKKYNKRAFTILELLVTIAIIAVIAAIVVPNFIGAIDRSRDARELAEVNSVTKAVGIFYSEHGYYPTLQGDQPTLGNPKNIKFSSIYPDYLASLPHFSYWWVDHTGKVVHTKSSIASIEGNVLTIANSSKQPVTYRAITKNLDGTVTTQTYTSGTISLSPNTIVEVISDQTGEVILTLNSSFTAPLMDPNDPDYGAEAPNAILTMTPSTEVNSETEIVFNSSASTAGNKLSVANRQWSLDNKLLASTDVELKQVISEAGDHTIGLRVQDSVGVWSDWTYKTFTVMQANHAPVAVISVTPNTAIYNDTNIVWGYESSTDEDGNAIVAAEWQLDSNPIVTSAPNGLLPAGNHTMKLRVKDTVGAWSQWVSTDITVNSLLDTVLTTVDTTKWKRYDDTNAGIQYIGGPWTAATSAGNYNSTVHTVLSNPAPVTNRIDFTFYGTKLRIIGTQNFDFTTDLALYIDGVQVQVNSVKTATGTTKQVLNLEVYGLSLGEHKVSIHAVSDASRWNLDAIDVGSDGHLVTPVEGNYLNGGYVSLSSAYGLYDANNMGKFTLEAWVRRPSIPSSGIAEIMATSEGGGYELFVNNYGYLYMSLHIGGGYKYVASSAAMPVNQWIHVASTFDGQYMKMYVNGVLNNTVSVTGSINSGTYLVLGANPPDMSSGWGGDLSNVRVWKVARTAQQIKDSMYGWLSGSETGLIGYWKLNEASGTVAHDSSPSGKNGAVVNGTWKQ